MPKQSEQPKSFPALEQAARECHLAAARDCTSECFEWPFEDCIAKECKQARVELKAAELDHAFIEMLAAKGLGNAIDHLKRKP